MSFTDRREHTERRQARSAAADLHRRLNEKIAEIETERGGRSSGGRPTNEPPCRVGHPTIPPSLVELPSGAQVESDPEGELRDCHDGERNGERAKVGSRSNDDDGEEQDRGRGARQQQAARSSRP
jgi:hypothetical protein